MKANFLLVLFLITQQAVIFSHDTLRCGTITFETSYVYLKTDTTSECIWQIAQPQKLFFDAAFSGEKAILTDSVNNYPVNNHSFFELRIGRFNMENGNYPDDIGVVIYHKYDTDTLKDGLYITISIDYGQTWQNIFEEYPDNSNLYYYDTPYSSFLLQQVDTLCNGELGFSGRSAGWVKTHFEWFFPYVKSDWIDLGDTIVLRFNFVSDDLETHKEGWMIDNVGLYSVKRTGGSVRVFGDSNLASVYPNPHGKYIHVELDKIYPDIQIEFIDLKGSVLDVMKYSNTNHIQIEYDNWSQGINFLRITLNKETVCTKRIISLRR